MKLPDFPKLKRTAKPKPNAGKAAGKPQVRPPRALEDLYRDMRDRRLLLPAVALLVAIAVVPVALSASKEELPVPLAYTPPEGSEAVAPAVLTEQSIGIRDYRQRLDELKSKNPFASSFSFPKGDGGGGASAATESVPADPIAVPGGAVVNAPGVTNNDATGPETPTPVDPPVDTGSDDSSGDVVLVVAPRIEVLAGPVGKRKRLENVEIGDLLPDRRNAPIAMLMGVSDDLKFADFVVSDDVTETSGEGQCRPRANDCEFLRLRDTEKSYFTFGPDDERFSIKITDIREKVVDRRKVKSS